MKKAAEYIVGEHDFASFCSAGSQVKTTVRTVYTLDVSKENDIISIRISGNGFLYNMVRIIVGTLMKVGLGSLHTGTCEGNHRLKRPIRSRT